MPPNPPADLHGHEVDLRYVQPQDAGSCVPNLEGALGAAPDRHPAIPVPERGSVVKLDVALVNGLGVELTLHHVVRLGKCLSHVSHSVLEVAGYVADLVRLLTKFFGLQVIVQERSAFPNSVQDCGHGFEDLIFDVDEINGFLGHVGVHRRYPDYGVSRDTTPSCWLGRCPA